MKKTITKEQLKEYIHQLDEYLESISETLHDPSKWDETNHLNASDESGSNPGVPPPPPPPTPQ